MRYRFLRRRPASAPKLTIRTHVPWPVRVGVGLAGLAVAAAIGAWWASGVPPWAQRDQDRAELASLREGNRALRAERDRLIVASNAIDSKSVMERATLKGLSDQIARLETENAKLKEEVAFFEAATTERRIQTSVGGIAIRRFQVTEDASAHTVRYRLLVTQDSRANRDFVGELQLVVTISQAGKTANIILPGSSAAGGARNAGPLAVSVDGDAAQFRVAFRSYKRIEGSLRIPAGVALKALHAKILERGVVRAQQTVTLG